MQSFALTLFADYQLFYIQDEAADGDLSDSWDAAAGARLLALAPGTIGIGTARIAEVPVTVEIRSRPVATASALPMAGSIRCPRTVSKARIAIASSSGQRRQATSAS